MALELRPDWVVRDSDMLSVDDTRLILYGYRLLILAALRSSECLHENHRSMEGTRRWARLQHIDQEWMPSYVSSNIWPLTCSRMGEGSSLLSRMHTSIYDLGRTAQNVINTFRYSFTVTVIPALLHTDSRPQFKDCYLELFLKRRSHQHYLLLPRRLPVHKCAFDKILEADARTNEQMNNTRG